MPKVSIVIPVYNGAKFIKETLNSILKQTYKDFEILVIDDGSTDDTAEIIAGFQSPVRLIKNEHKGKSFSRNTGIRAALGEFIALVDADDLWMPNKLELQIEYLTNHPELKWVYSDCYIFEGNKENKVDIWSRHANKLFSGDILKPLLNDDFIASPTPVVSRSVFDEVGFFDETFLMHEPEDWDMWLRIASRYSIGLINEPLALLRRHKDSLTAKEDTLKTFEGIMYVVQLAISRNEERLGNIKKKIYSYRYLSIGKGLSRLGRNSEARVMYVNALHNDPMNIKIYFYYFVSMFLPQTIIQQLHDLNVCSRKFAAKNIIKQRLR